ncbi:hypothetical protein CSKR_201643 [Clonorchis sinensis]|uniref:Uncharacterized protein n=1 Tax=Clonorchis sinensis TaxID=79923 RepID=A0A8T1MTY4_CLOSI|nr:hypothetical protein CSKR_201643 [Clonorchis sinensis]
MNVGNFKCQRNGRYTTGCCFNSSRTLGSSPCQTVKLTNKLVDQSSSPRVGNRSCRAPAVREIPCGRLDIIRLGVGKHSFAKFEVANLRRVIIEQDGRKATRIQNLL